VEEGRAGSRVEPLFMLANAAAHAAAGCFQRRPNLIKKKLEQQGNQITSKSRANQFTKEPELIFYQHINKARKWIRKQKSETYLKVMMNSDE
jgi:hypothetical protein